MSLAPGAAVYAYYPSLISRRRPGHWEPIQLGGVLGAGGTAQIYEKPPFPVSREVIKVFTVPLDRTSRADYFAKLEVMAHLRVKFGRRLPFVAGPQALVFRTRDFSPDGLIGCVLPFVPNAWPLANFTLDYATLQKAYQDIRPNTLNPYTQRQIALNIVEALDLLHRNGILFGDPNANNILVDLTTFDVAFIDTDSFGVRFPPPGRTTEDFYPPPATTLGFRSPRVARQTGPSNARITTYTEADDNYVCAIHLFSLLVPGFLPWLDISPEAEQRAMRGHFAYAGPYASLPPNCYQMRLFNDLPPSIQKGFVNAFVYGNPPTPGEWRALFKTYWRGLQGQITRPTRP